MVLAVVCAAAAAALLVSPRVELHVARPAAGAPALRLPRSSVLAGCSAALIALLLAPTPFAFLVAPLAAVMAARFVARLEPVAVRRRRSALEAALPQVVDPMSVCLAESGELAAGGVPGS